jgi:hypothetical protein
MRAAVPRDRVPEMPKQNVQFEPDAWWWARNRIGQDLRERYEVPKDLPPKLRALVRKLDDSDWLFPAVSWGNDRDFFRLPTHPVVVKGPDGWQQLPPGPLY